MQDRPEVMFRLSGRVDVDDWRRRHERGEVPDAWPYGLDRMAAHGVRVTPAPAYTGDPRVARLARGLGGRYEWLESRTSAGAPDAVLCWDERVGVPSARNARGPKVLTGVIWLTDEQRTSRTHRLLAGSALRRAHRVWALSSAQLPVLRDDFGVPEKHLVHLPFGIDTDFFRPAATDPEPGLVIGAGNDRHRDHPALVAAVGTLRRTDPAVRLELATRQAIEVPAELGARHTALTHPQMRALYGRGAVVAVALRPNLHVSGISVILEAMACGRPVVVSDTPGMRDYVTHGSTGLLVPPGEVSAFAAAIRDLLTDPQRAAEMGAAARRDVERRFSTQVQAGHLAALL
ncbi:glycosyl transferase [Paractinoplanes deccanensis]|uniref:Glycosyl transferase n=1 Tax=Paractinoplanes deccanensis TaxID=113561 RepID=A0ABQ3YBJ7_9ACTN|nr:glycosyltransferase family 4 protein [Actinoplanes deccanensis]GID77290.1 glycosyl transferase [Actinoplanes deccanensis]